MKKYKYLNETKIACFEQLNPQSFSEIHIIQGQTRKRTVQDGTEQVQFGETEPVLDEEGNVVTPAEPIYEARPKFIEEEYSPWDELMAEVAAGNVTIQEQDIEPVKQEALQTVNSQRDSLIHGGIDFNGYRYQTDKQSILDIMGAVIAGADTDWLTEDNQIVSMTAADLQALGQAVAGHKTSLVYQARQHKNAILALGAIAEIEQYIDNLTWS